MAQSSITDLDFSDDQSFGADRLGVLAMSRSKAQASLTLRSPKSLDGVAARRLTRETIQNGNSVNVSSTGALLLDEDDEADGVFYDVIGSCRIRFTDGYNAQASQMSDGREIDVYMQARQAIVIITSGLKIGAFDALSGGDFVYLRVGIGYKPYRVADVQAQTSLGGNSPIYSLEPTGEILYEDDISEIMENGF